MRGLYAQAALLAHDCIGNTFITLDDNKQLKVFASVDIKAGDIVYNNYTATLYVSFSLNKIKTIKYLDSNAFVLNRAPKHGKSI